MTDGSRHERIIRVDYAAGDAVADADRLCRWLHDEIERHLLSIAEVPIDGWTLHARIEECRMAPNDGAARVALGGAIGGRAVDELVAVEDRPAPAGWTIEEQENKATKVAFANLFTLLGRLLFPSELVRALGRRRISGRLVRAWHDCCREIRIRIDAAVGRPESGGRMMLGRTMRAAVLAGLACFALAVAAKLLVRTHPADHFRAWLACGLIGIGIFGVIAAGGMLRLPSRFFQSEQHGLALVRLFGVKTLAGIRTVCCGLLLLSLVFALAPGVYWLFFE